MLGFKVIRNFATSSNFEDAHKQFNHKSGKSKALKKETIGLQCHQKIPRHVTIIYDNRINFIENINVFKDLNEVPLSNDWLPYEYNDAEVNKKIDEIRIQHAGNEMEKETNHYVKSLNHDPNLLKKFSIKIDKFLINFNRKFL